MWDRQYLQSTEISNIEELSKEGNYESLPVADSNLRENREAGPLIRAPLNWEVELHGLGAMKEHNFMRALRDHQ
jgi:hypothetical protein